MLSKLKFFLFVLVRLILCTHKRIAADSMDVMIMVVNRLMALVFLKQNPKCSKCVCLPVFLFRVINGQWPNTR